MEVNYATDKVVSFSQYSTYKSCPHKWYLEYVKGHRDTKPNMYLIFGLSFIGQLYMKYYNIIYKPCLIHPQKKQMI